MATDPKINSPKEDTSRSSGRLGRFFHDYLSVKGRNGYIILPIWFFSGFLLTFLGEGILRAAGMLLLALLVYTYLHEAYGKQPKD